MNRFAALLDRLALEPRRNAKLTLLEDYFRSTSDPARGYALAAMTGALSFRHAKPALIRQLISERVDPVLFQLSYDYVGDLSETVALLWPASPQPQQTLDLATIVERLHTASRSDIPALLTHWLDALDETGRWALLKLVTGSLRIGVSARLAKSAVARIGNVPPDAVEEVWHGLTPPYTDLFAWVEGRGPVPSSFDPAPFRPPMLAHALEESDFAALDPRHFAAEWKWDGIRVQIAAGRDATGHAVCRLYSRTGEDISGAFPDLVEQFQTLDAAIDGELLIRRDGRIESFNTLQQRLNRKTIAPKLIAEFPAHVRAYDLLAEGGEDMRALSFDMRRQKLETLVTRLAIPALDLSARLRFASWEELARQRAAPHSYDAEAIEGCMIKRRDSPYVPGRPKGLWFKWKRDPHEVDCVLMYAQRGHGKRSSYYSDFTFGVWRDAELVPVGKAYFGFTDEELLQLDRFVRNNTVARFGPVREVTHTAQKGLVLQIAFEGLQRSTRHKSGVAMRFPRIARIRWDKPPAEADRLETLEKLLKSDGI
ncbi:MAG: cisplatin damage response ATP-dependent DNA ligase [Beijerinckiaceae bacterium]